MDSRGIRRAAHQNTQSRIMIKTMPITLNPSHEQLACTHHTRCQHNLAFKLRCSRLQLEVFDSSEEEDSPVEAYPRREKLITNYVLMRTRMLQRWQNCHTWRTSRKCHDVALCKSSLMSGMATIQNPGPQTRAGNRAGGYRIVRGVMPGTGFWWSWRCGALSGLGRVGSGAMIESTPGKQCKGVWIPLISALQLP